MSRHLLEVKNLSVAVKRDDRLLPLLDDVSFHVDAGETLGIVGESGSGKSTTGLSLLKLTPRSCHPYTHGQINFDGRNVLDMRSDELTALRGRNISMILQDPMSSLNPVLSIGEQIAEAFLTHGLATRTTVNAKVLAALQQVRIQAAEAVSRSYPHQLSGGMKQRVAGAIAVACRPRLLIADEPTTALDVTIQAGYLTLLKSLQQELGMGLLFITHDFGVVARMCDRVCVMYAGQIVETAPVREIFRRPRHWYSAALLDSLPKLSGTAERLASIAGSPPKPGEQPAGCRFAPRCTNAQPRCHQQQPPLQTLDELHELRCWYPRDTPAGSPEESE